MFAIAVIIVLMGVAIALLLLEIFLLPGVTLAGIGGILFAVGGLSFAYSVSALAGHLTCVISLLLFAALFVWLLRAGSFSKVALHAEIGSHVESGSDWGIVPGDEGVTLSRLAPMGKASIRGKTVEVKALDELIDESQPIVVTAVESGRVVVELKEKE